MAMTLLEKILADHSGRRSVSPGEILDIKIDTRVARDFGGANVIGNIREHGLSVNDPSRTYFTFDCNPTGSDQKYAVNQHACRVFAREHGIKVFDIDAGIGTHIMIDRGLAYPGCTAVSTDSHANILGAVGSFGQGMGDMDIAAAWDKGKIWFKVPPSVKINLNGKISEKISPKDIILNLLGRFGASSLLGYSVEISGPVADHLDLDARITISSMATEMGAIIILFPPSKEILDYCSRRTDVSFHPAYADADATYEKVFDIDVSGFKTMVSLPGQPHDVLNLDELPATMIDSAFIGSCTNGRITDMRKAAALLKDRKVAPGVILKIVPGTNEIWDQCLEEGLINIFRKAGALVSNAGCAGCAAGQVGQNGAGEITVSTGNRNFPGKQGKGSVYLASPEVVAASAIAGYITAPGRNLVRHVEFRSPEKVSLNKEVPGASVKNNPDIIEGKVWLVEKDNIDTDMIFHNRYLSVTDLRQMGQYTFDNLKGFEDFAGKAKPGDIVVTGKNFGCGSSRQQAVDCFKSLGIQALVAESYGAIYERNAINAAFPILTYRNQQTQSISDGDILRINFRTGEMENLTSGTRLIAEPFSDVQYEIYKKGGLLG